MSSRFTYFISLFLVGVNWAMAKPHPVINGTASRFCRDGHQLVLLPATEVYNDFYFCQLHNSPPIGDQLRYKILALGAVKIPNLSDTNRRKLELARNVSIQQSEAAVANLLIFIIGPNSSTSAADIAYRSAELGEANQSLRSAKTMLLRLVDNSNISNQTFDFSSNAYVVQAKEGMRVIYLQTVTERLNGADIRERIEGAWMQALGMSLPTSNYVP